LGSQHQTLPVGLELVVWFAGGVGGEVVFVEEGFRIGKPRDEGADAEAIALDPTSVRTIPSLHGRRYF